MMRRWLILFVLLFFMYSVACTAPQATEPLPTPESEKDDGLPYEVKAAGKIPEEVSVTYREMLAWYNAERQKEEPSFSTDTPPLTLLYDADRSIYIPISYVWYMEEYEDGLYFADAQYDATGVTHMAIYITEPEDLPWLTIYGEKGEGVSVLIQEEKIKEHGEEYFLRYAEEMLKEPKLTVTKKPKPMQFSCCQGGMLDFSGSIAGKDVQGSYGIFGNEMGCYQFILISNDTYIDVAREEFYFYLSNVGHWIYSQEEADAMLEYLGGQQPKRW
ncbi:hypothetical protein LJC20_02525 [Eubacteriales bacterium OttesenSCG-928-M02]|nr:hypothetical protein [Eubacteriales bacterium OttesenSCG-928-M02]